MDPTVLAQQAEPVLTSIPGGEALLLEAYRHKSVPAALQHQSPRTCRRNASLVPIGVQRSLPADFLSEWTCQFENPYSHATTPEELEAVPAEATHIFVGARNPAGEIVLGACGRRDKVLQRSLHTDEDGETHEENGVFWYFAFEIDGDGVSFGFSRVPEISLKEADVGIDGESDDDASCRLSWHIDGESDGWRAGSVLDPPDWTKLLYWISLPGWW